MRKNPPEPIFDDAPDLSLPPATSTKEILARMAEGVYLLDPVIGCQDLVRATLFPEQQQIARQLFLGKKKKVSVRAGHGFGKCNSINDLAYLSNGTLITFGELIGKHFEILSVDENFIVYKASAFAQDNGIQPVWRITTEKGRQITRTGEHPLWHRPCIFKAARRPTWGDPYWKCVQDLQVGDLVCVPEALPIEGHKAIAEWKVKILAYLIGDGCTIRNAQFTQIPGVQLTEVKQIVSSLGLKMSRHESSGNPHDYRIVGKRGRNNNNVVLRLLKKTGVLGRRSGDHKVPDCIWTTPNNQLALFLSRLFSADGWACLSHGNKKSNGEVRIVPQIGFCSKSERLIRDIHHACLRFGIAGTIRKMKKTWTHKEEKKSGYYWEWGINDARSVLRFIDRIGIYGKEAACAEVKAHCESAFVAQRNAAPQRGAQAWEGKDKRALRWPYYGLPDGFRWEKIRSIEYRGEEPTVCVSVPDNETFLTDFVEHNSHLIGILGAYFFLSRQPAVLIIASKTAKQVMSQTWNYLGRSIENSWLKGRLEHLKTELRVIGREKDWFARWVSIKNPNNAEGFHSPNLFWIIDEAKSVEPAVFEAAMGAFSQGNSYFLVVSTCGPARGYFYETHRTRLDQWDAFHFPSWTSPYVGEEQLAAWRREWGEDSPIYQARVAAEFPEESDDCVVPLSWLARSVEGEASEEY